MTIKSALYSIRRYGLKGIVDYFRRMHSTYAFNRFLLRRSLAPKPIKGITVITTLDYPGSLSKTMRDFCILLDRAHIPHQVLNTPCKNPIPESEFLHLTTPKEQFISNKYTHIITMRSFIKVPDNRCTCDVIEFWEFEDGLVESQPEVLYLKHILTMSDFNCTTFKKLLPKASVSKILYPFQFTHGELTNPQDTRKKYHIPSDSFMIFFNFDFASSYYRKNPEAVLHAFSRAFTPDDNAILVFKTMRAKQCQKYSCKLHALANDLNIQNKLFTIDDFIPQEDLVNLTNASDVYISLHRGEGFGIGIAEAMSLGKPVIVTDYSSTTEFCKPDSALLIPYQIKTVKPDQIDVDAYKHVTQWADPDINAAAKALRRLYDDPGLREKLGTNAQNFIKSYFSIENFKKSIEDLIR